MSVRRVMDSYTTQSDRELRNGHPVVCWLRKSTTGSWLRASAGWMHKITTLQDVQIAYMLVCCGRQLVRQSRLLDIRNAPKEPSSTRDSTGGFSLTAESHLWCENSRCGKQFDERHTPSPPRLYCTSFHTATKKATIIETNGFAPASLG